MREVLRGAGALGDADGSPLDRRSRSCTRRSSRTIPTPGRPRPQGAWRSRPTAPMPTSCWPSTPGAARRRWSSTRRGSPPASGRSGPRSSADEVGHFWGSSRPGPTCGARLGLADMLWTLGRRDEAVEHLQDMLRLNPNDNQGVRYTLAAWLLNLDRDDDLDRLLDQYPDEGSAAWAYTRALLAFRREGDTPEARKLLQEARKRNKHVPDYLLGHEPLPPRAARLLQPRRRERGDHLRRHLPGRLEVHARGRRLAQGEANAGAQGRKAARPRRPRGRPPWPRQRLREAAAGVRRLAGRLPPAPALDRGRRASRSAPGSCWSPAGATTWSWPTRSPRSRRTADLLWDTLAEAMQQPGDGRAAPARPSSRSAADPRWEALRPHLEEIGIACVPVEELDQLDFVFESLSEQLGRRRAAGPAGDARRSTPEQVAGFYEAAAELLPQGPLADGRATRRRSRSSATGSRAAPGTPW